MNEELYFVTEVGGFGEMPVFESNDPTISKVDKKKKKKELDKLMKEAMELNKKNFG